MAEPLLKVDELKVSFRTEEGVVTAVDGVSFEVEPGEVLAVVGESGSGKSVTAMTLMGLTRSPNAHFEGTAHYKGQDLVTATDDELRRVRGSEIAMIFQDPMTSLNPVVRIGEQIVEQIQEHTGIPNAQAMQQAIELLERVGIPRAADRARSYPFEFSGGMRQRVMIALALSCDPSILIADEPTTALDVTIQAQILQRIRDLREQTGAAVILVTHDLGVVADIADRIAVMYAGPHRGEGHARRHLLRPPASHTPGACWGRSPALTGRGPSACPRSPACRPRCSHPPEGCHFRARCPHEFAKCMEVPPLEPRAGGEPATSTAAG